MQLIAACSSSSTNRSISYSPITAFLGCFNQGQHCSNAPSREEDNSVSLKGQDRTMDNGTNFEAQMDRAKDVLLQREVLTCTIVMMMLVRLGRDKRSFLAHPQEHGCHSRASFEQMCAGIVQCTKQPHAQHAAIKSIIYSRSLQQPQKDCNGSAPS